MDQMASSVGGLVFIDFALTARSEKVGFYFSTALRIIDSHVSTQTSRWRCCYSDGDEKAGCSVLRQQVLNDVDEQAFMSPFPPARKAADRAATGARRRIFEENQCRSARCTVNRLLTGRSSWLKLQNVTALGAARRQEMGIYARAVQEALKRRGRRESSRRRLRRHDALAFVPNDRFAEFKAGVEQGRLAKAPATR